MALVDTHRSPIATPAPTPALPAATGQPLINVNQLRTAFSNPKADITCFYGFSTFDKVSAKFLLERIRIAHTIYGWTDITTAGNFRLVLRGKAILWLNYSRDTLEIDIFTWTNIEPEFIKHFNVKTSTVDNVWDFSKLKHEDQETPA